MKFCQFKKPYADFFVNRKPHHEIIHPVQAVVTFES